MSQGSNQRSAFSLCHHQASSKSQQTPAESSTAISVPWQAFHRSQNVQRHNRNQLTFFSLVTQKSKVPSLEMARSCTWEAFHFRCTFPWTSASIIYLSWLPVTRRLPAEVSKWELAACRFCWQVTSQVQESHEVKSRCLGKQGNSCYLRT